MNASEGPRDAGNSANDNNQHHEPLHEVSAYAVCNGIGQKESGDAGGKADQGIMYDLRRVQAGPILQNAGEEFADGKEDTQGTKHLPWLPVGIHGIDAGRRTVQGDGSSEHAGEEAGCRCHAGTFPPGPDAAKGRPQGEQDKEGADQDTQPEFRKHPEDVDSRHGPRQRCRQHGQKRFPEAGAQMHQGHAGIDKEVQDAADQDDLAQGQEKWCSAASAMPMEPPPAPGVRRPLPKQAN